MKTIIVLGFGRSGTTWISDIISKISGNLILFEPFHPSVTEHSRMFSYSYIDGGEASSLLKNYLNDVLTKRHRKMWLMRNHVPVALDRISNTFLNRLWVECAVLGFKEIRANFMIEWFYKNIDCKIVFILRHPCAVIASIKNRSNFWEFGWPETYELFLRKTIYHNRYKNHKIRNHTTIIKNAQTDIAKYTVMYALTHAIALPQLEQLGIPIFFYEDFYADPFGSVRRLSEYLGNGSVNIHPSYIFTPAMTTLKTFHGIHAMEENIANKGASLFWENELSGKEVNQILEIVNTFGISIYNNDEFAINRYRVKNTEHMIQSIPN